MQRRSTTSPVPVRSQFLAMKGGPFEYQRHGSPREISPEDGERLYLDEGLVSAIFGMKMRRSVVVKNTFGLQSQRIELPQAFPSSILPSPHVPRAMPRRSFAIRTPRAHSFFYQISAIDTSGGRCRVGDDPPRAPARRFPEPRLGQASGHRPQGSVSLPTYCLDQ